MKNKGNIELNKRQVQIYVFWLLALGFMHYTADPYWGLLGTVMTMTTIGVVTLLAIYFIESNL